MSIELNPEFQKSFRGYRVEEVDQFVDQISAAYEQMRQELIKVNHENEKFKHELEHYEQIEASLNKALVAAQEKADEIINKARQEVDGALGESKQRLDNINTEIAEILAEVTEKARQIEEEAHHRAEEILRGVEAKAAAEKEQSRNLEQQLDQTKQEMVQVLNEFLIKLENTGNDAASGTDADLDPDPDAVTDAQTENDSH
ncbi:MAG TPA: DivIVA domain-containing protein [Desulfobacteria bacterium]|nr:DivIVA domain-containing protein [Desulfobacteria bacterium]